MINKLFRLEFSHHLKWERESAKPLVNRSSDGVGSVNDIFDHRRGTIRGTAEIKES